jgi:hypothetical protein
MPKTVPIPLSPQRKWTEINKLPLFLLSNKDMGPLQNTAKINDLKIV